MNVPRAPLTPYPAAPRLLAPAVVLAAALLAVLTALAPPAAGAQERAVRGGDTLHGASGVSCRVAFNAGRDGERYALMSGRCARDAGPVWYYEDAGTPVEIGRTDHVYFPGTDFAVIHYTNPDFTYPSELSAGAGQPIAITRAAYPTIGAEVCHAGGATGVHCGRVTSMSISVSYPEGVVHDLFQSNACTEPGAAGGGPGYHGGTALGIIVSANGSCPVGGTTYYQPVAGALQTAGLSLY